MTPYLWFDTQAEEAAHLYLSIFPESSLDKVNRPGGQVMMVEFSLAGQPFIALNGGPMFSFNPSVSLYVVCETEEEIQEMWEKLAEDGKVLMPLDAYAWSAKYGWVQDRYGLSWQLSLGKGAAGGQKISPAFLFAGEQRGKAETAIQQYTSLFPNSEIQDLSRYEAGDSDPAIGTLKHAEFTLKGMSFRATDNSHDHGGSFNEAISFVIHCRNQAEVDHYWEQLSEGGEEMMCGWLKDRFGVVWQILPDELIHLINDPDPERAQRASGAMMRMRKIDIDTIHKAANGELPPIFSVQAMVMAPIWEVWEKWTQPEHIIHWNFATDAWNAPAATSDLQEGGAFSYRMEAKDGSMGFDFTGTFTTVQAPHRLGYRMEDGRQVELLFSEAEGGTFVMQDIEAENQAPIERQQQGWQAIMNHFKRYVEGQ
ncbi:MAG: VOC family protein [Bacteroidota bacterium]